MRVYQANKIFKTGLALLIEGQIKILYRTCIAARNINYVYLVHTAISVLIKKRRVSDKDLISASQNAAAFLFHRHLIQCIHCKAI